VLKSVTKFGVTLALMGGLALWLTRPQVVEADALAGLTADVENGALVFAAAGCASCHTAPESEDKAVLAGGRAFATDFGRFYAPNISTDPTHGIGGWTDAEIASAVVEGTSPDGSHYYPAFPYASYGRMELQDVVDLAAFLRTLPADDTPNTPHAVSFPFNIRASLGGWKFLFASPDWVVGRDLNAEQLRGRMLVEGMGHCGECHTPRNALGGLQRTDWLGGAPVQGGSGRVPSLRAADLQWSEADIVAYLKTGLTPEYDSAGGEMVDVIANTSQLPDSDLEAIAAYLQIVGADS